MKNRMRSRWQRLQRETTAERATLRSQRRALRRIGARWGFRDALPPGEDQDRIDPAADALVAAALDQTDTPWWPAFAQPGARTTRQNNLVRYRNAETKRFLQWMRKTWYPSVPNRTPDVQRNDGFGSIFDGKIPTSALEASVTQVEHQVAQSWMENTELLVQFAHCREDINNTLPVPAMQNSKKGARPIWFVSDTPSDPQKVDHSWFYLDDRSMFTPDRQAACAARIFYMFLSNPMVTQQSDAQSALDQQGKGCGYYANEHVHRHMLSRVREQTPLPHDVFQNVLTLYVFKTYNPLLQERDLFDTHEFADDFRSLLKERLDGSTSFPKLCGQALRSAVSGFPV